MKKRISSIFFVLLSLLFLPAGFSQADISTNITTRRAALENELGQLEKEIESQQLLLTGKQRESVSLERDIAILDVQIEKAKLEIKARKLSIEKLSSDIDGKIETIGELSDKMSREKSSLSELMRKTNEVDYFTLTEIFLSNDNLSNFCLDTDSFEVIQKNLQESLVKVGATKDQTEEAKNSLEEKKAVELELKGIKLEVEQGRENSFAFSKSA
jgi:septal ring factor EnvC (AmiA/AmiB activator)